MAARVIVSADIPASRSRVWADVADLAEHPRWMTDAHTITFLTKARAGVGTRMEVETRFGPLRASDVLEVTGWDPYERIAVAHRGLFTGSGEFTFADHGGGTRVTWTEQIRFPWFFGGRVGARLARPVLTRVWTRDLRNLCDRFNGR